VAQSEIDAVRALLSAKPRPVGWEERRRRIEEVGSVSPVADDVKLEAVDLDGVAAEWSIVPGSDPSRVLMFFHGGGYCSGSILSHRRMVTEAGRAGALRTLAVGYRLAPEHPFPAAVEDAVAAYRFLLSSGVPAGGITIAGDSAGGGLVVAAMLAIRDAGLAQPACGWAISPWVDMEAIGGSMASKAATDPTVQKAGILDMARLYLNGAGPRSPLAAPIYGDLRGLAPLLIQVGAAETLLDDAIRLAQVAGAADVAVDLQIWPEMIHVWHVYYPDLSAGRRAIAAGGEFARAMTSRGSRSLF